MSGFGGGISSFILNKATYFQNKDIVFDVITFDEVSDGFMKTIQGTGGQVYRISNLKTQGTYTYYKEVNKIMKRVPKDTFIHCHIGGYRAIPFYIIARKNGLKRFGIHAHTTGLPEEINSLKNRAVRMINNTVANERISCGVEASKYLYGSKYVEKNEIMHIPNSIVPEQFINHLDIDKADLLGEQNKDKFVIGHIGRFRSVKNHLFMLSIIEILKESSLDFLWLFAGDGNDYEKIKTEATDKGLNQYIQFLGRRDDIPQLLQVMDVFALPSKYEGFPTVAIESQTSDTKTLLSDTITKEVDLQLGLVEFLPTNKPDMWAEFILKQQPHVKTAPEVRLNKLKEKKLTNKESAELYQAFVEQKITHYELK
jgi:glycosyltransferase involved in cell wall biosynthesis